MGSLCKRYVCKNDHKKYANKLVEGYEKYTGSELKVQKTPGDLGTTISKSDLEETDNINKHISFVEQLMWYKTKVGTYVTNAERELLVKMSHLGTEHGKKLGIFIRYLKGKDTKGIIIRKPKVMKAVMFCESKYSKDKDTRKILSVLVTTLGGTLLTCLSKPMGL